MAPRPCVRSQCSFCKFLSFLRSAPDSPEELKHHPLPSDVCYYSATCGTLLPRCATPCELSSLMPPGLWQENSEYKNLKKLGKTIPTRYFTIMQFFRFLKTSKDFYHSLYHNDVQICRQIQNFTLGNWVYILEPLLFHDL